MCPITVRKSMVIEPFLALGRRRLSPTPAADRSCGGGRASRDGALGWHEGLRAGSVTWGCAAGAEVCCWARLGIGPCLLLSHSGGLRHWGKLVFLLRWACWLRVRRLNLSF